MDPHNDPTKKRKSREQEARAWKRRRDRETDRRAHEHVGYKIIRAFLADSTKTKKAAVLKTSHLKDLTDEKAKLFRVLSAKDYNEEKKPRMNVDATALTSNRTLNSVENRLSEWQVDWKGTTITGELIHFLSKGYHHEQQPGGFHVFMASSRRDPRCNTASRNELLRSVLGDEKVTSDQIYRLSKRNITLPQDVTQAEIMLETTIALLDKMTAVD